MVAVILQWSLGNWPGITLNHSKTGTIFSSVCSVIKLWLCVLVISRTKICLNLKFQRNVSQLLGDFQHEKVT